MPVSAPRPCRHPGCGVLVRDSSGRCEKHQLEAWTKRIETPTKRITGRRLQEARKRLFSANPLCVMCDELGIAKLATQRDHRVPLFEGGADDDDNAQGLCDDHHREKTLVEALRARRRNDLRE